jgi:hypothetical protein
MSSENKNKATVYVVDLPAVDGVNGPDDFISVKGDLALEKLLDAARPFIDNDDASEFSDDALALDFSAQYGDDHRYVATWGRWYRFTDDSVWREDTTLDASTQCARSVAKPVSWSRTNRRWGAS